MADKKKEDITGSEAPEGQIVPNKVAPPAKTTDHGSSLYQRAAQIAGVEKEEADAAAFQERVEELMPELADEDAKADEDKPEEAAEEYNVAVPTSEEVTKQAKGDNQG